MKKLTKEQSIQIGNILLILGLVTLLFALLTFFFPYQEKISGLKLIFNEEYRNSFAIATFSLYLISLVVGVLVYIIKTFPWGKILLLAFGIIILLAACLLLAIDNKNGGLIFSFIFALFSGAFYIAAALLK